MNTKVTLKFGEEITGKLVRETIKSIPVSTYNKSTFKVESNYEAELKFKNAIKDYSKGDFALYVNTDRMKTTVTLYSWKASYECDYDVKEWNLEDMTSKDWRFIEDKIRRAKKRIACEKKVNQYYWNSGLNFSSMKYDRSVCDWADNFKN